MKTKGKLLGVLLILVLALFCSFAVSCGEETPETPPVEKTEWPEAGIYYFDSKGDECTLTLNVGDTFSLYVDGKYQSGTYTLKDEELVLDFHAESEGEITADYQGNSISLTYDGSALRFLKKISYTVTFDKNDGGAKELQTVVNGKNAIKPEDPERTGFVFVGWYADSAFTTPYTFGAQPVTADTTVYARWSEALAGGAEFDVALDANYAGAEALDGVKTFGGKLFDLPELEREGYTFGGWWFSPDGGAKLSHKYEDGTVLKGGDTLYALWIEAPKGSSLAAPVVNVTAGTVSWAAVDGARSYLVTVKAPSGELLVEETTAATTVNVPFASFAAGEYEVKVVAQANTGDSNNSECIRYYVNKALSKVSVFNVVEPSTLVFGGVENAEKYLITVVCGNSEHEHTLFDNGSSKTFSFANCEMTSAGIRFTVTAVAEGYASSVSDTFTYVRNLDAVGELRFDEATETVSWSEVDRAESYMVSITCGSSAHDHTLFNNGGSTSVSLKACAPCEGGIVVKVWPVTKGYNSPEASEYVYVKSTIGTPSNLTVAGTVLSWDAVDGAASYEIKVGSYAFTSEVASFDLAGLVDMTEGTRYEITVRAKGETTSLYSDTLEVICDEMSDKISYSNGTLTWMPVVGADRYEIQVNDGEITTAEGAASSAIVLGRAGDNTVRVRYVRGSYVSEWVSTTVFAHRVSFDTLGGTGVADQFKAVGDPITLPETEKAGYTFAGWYNAPGGPAANGGAYNDGFFSESGAIVLYAHYNAKKYEITYNYGVGGTGDVLTDEVTFEQGYKLTVPTATDVAGAFGGWFSAPYGMGVQYTDENGKSLVPWSHLEGKELYAFWIDNTLSFTLTKLNGRDVYAVGKGVSIALVSELTIPATYRGLPVAYVIGNAFQGCSNLTVINLPASIEQISAISPFGGCIGLEAINVYDVDGVSDPVFTSDDGVLFKGDTTLYFVPTAKSGTYRIPAGVTSIPAEAFAGSAISRVVIPASVAHIGREAFRDCAKLASVVFETDGANAAVSLSVGARAFMNCVSLERINLPARLTEIQLQRYSIYDGVISTEDTENSFVGCYNLSAINVAADNTSYKSVDGVLYSKDGRTLILAPATLSGTFVIPEGTKNVSPGAFIGCASLKEVVLPGTLSVVGECAFYDLSNLEKLTLAGNAFGDLVFDRYAFALCDYLATVELSETSRLSVLGEGAFMGCGSLESFTFPATLTSVGASAFADCAKLERVAFAEGGKTLEFGEDAFMNCTSLSTVYLPANVSKIPGVFSGCTSLTEVNVAEGSTYFTSIEGVVFTADVTEIVFFPQSKSGEYTLPATVKKISNGVFRNVQTLSKLIVNNAITHIGNDAFRDSDIGEIEFTGETAEALTIGENAFYGAKLNNLTLPAHTTTVGDYAFYEADGDAVVLNEGVTSIGDFAFWGAELSVNIPASVKTIGNESFGGMSGYVGWNYVNSYPSVSFAEEGSVLETIGDRAFAGNENVTVLNLPATLKSVGNYAFYECFELETLTFAQGSVLETIGAHAFAGSGSWNTVPLKEVVIPASVTSIGAYAFAYTDLETLKIENGDGSRDLVIGTSYVETINNTVSGTYTETYTGYSFYYCQDLATVELPARLVELRESTFRYAGYYAKMTVSFVGENVRLATIGDECFYSSGLADFEIPASVRNLAPTTDPVTGEVYDRMGIGKSAFYGCNDYLEKLTFAEGGTEPLTIGEGAFENLDITTITLPARLATYTNSLGEVVAPLANGARVFNYCDYLTEVLVEAADGAYYASLNGALVTADGKEIVFCPAALEGSFNVPASVTVIHDRAFYNSKLTSITFEQGTDNMTIGASAFANCSSITSMVLPDNVISLGETVFYGCESLESLTLSAKLRVFNASMLSYCDALKEINVSSDGVGEFYSSANGILYSADKTVLVMYPLAKEDAEVTVDANVKVIFANAFSENDHVVKVNLPAGLVEIQSRAFYNCGALTEVNIPAGVQMIGERAFYNCYTLSNVTFDQSGSDLLIFSEYAFAGTTSLKTLAFPARLYSIGDCAFYESGITDVTFAENSSLVSIGVQAFHQSDIRGIVVPAGVISIGNEAFFECSNLSAVIFNEGLISIGDYAFAGCSELVSVAFPASLKTLGQSVFYRYYVGDEYPCPNLDTVTFASNSQLEYIPAGTFAYTALKSIVIPASVKYIEGVESSGYKTPSAFHEARELETVTFEQGSECAEIGAYTFASCSALEKIDLPASVLTIGNNAFNYCTSLKSIVVPEKATNLGSGVFWGCGALEDVDFRSKTTSIPDNFFYDCESLSELTIPAAVTSIAGNAFSGAGIASFEVAYGNLAYKAIDGILYTADGKGIVLIPPQMTLTSFTVPNTVTVIGERLFRRVGTLETLIFEGGRTEAITIGSEAFAECESLKTVVLTEKIADIGDEAFADCVSLVSINLPSDITESVFGDDVFYGCDKLVEICNKSEIRLEAGDGKCGGITNAARRIYSDGESAIATDENGFTTLTADGEVYLVSYSGNATNVVVPEGVTYINDYALSGIEVDSVVLPEGVKVIGNASFYDSYVGALELPTTLKKIDDNAFYYCSGFTSLILPEGFESIGYRSFYSSDISSIVFPSTLTSVGEEAFYYSNLGGNVSIGSSLAEIGYRAFYNCDDITFLVSVTEKPSGWDSSWNRKDYDGNTHATLWGFTGEEITYTFVTNGGDPVANVVDSAPITLPVPTRADHYFNGWYDNAELEGDPVSDGYYSSAKTTLYAKWLTQAEFDALFAGTSREYAIDVTLGETYSAEYSNGNKVYYKFTVETSGYYNIKLLTGDNVIYIYKSATSSYYDDYIWATFDYSSYEYLGVDSDEYLEAGTTYYFETRYYSRYDSGTMTFSIDVAE